MSSSKFVLRIITIVAIIAASSQSYAQSLNGPLTGGPSARPLPESNGYANPELLEYDLQPMTPFEVTSLDGYVEPNTGFYFTYDRTYLSTSRPSQVDSNSASFPGGNDFTWGNRYELGYMGESNTGYNLKWLGQEGGFFSAGQDSSVANPLMTRTGVDTVGINRTFRECLKGGGYFEPYVGIRYFGVNDSTIEDVLIVNGNNRFIQRVSNSMVGGHVGSRFVKRNGRFTNSFDFSVGAGYNSQSYFSSDITTIGTTIGLSEFNRTDSSFTPIVDLSAFSACNLTRDITFRIGVHMLYSWEGVVRANTLTQGLNPNSLPVAPINGIATQDFVAVGFSFGGEWRR